MQDMVYTELTEEQKLNPKVRGKIINEFAPLIKYIASRIAIRLPPHIDLNDLINAGVIGLIDAIEKFDASKQIKFKTYAEFRIRGAILDELRSMDWVPRSVRQKARKVEDTISKLEYVLGRPATDEEVAKEMNVDMESFYRLLSETASVSLLSLDDLGEDEGGDVFFGFRVDDLDLPALPNPSRQLPDGDVAARFGVVEPAVRVLFDDDGIGHGWRSPFRPVDGLQSLQHGFGPDACG